MPIIISATEMARVEKLAFEKLSQNYQEIYMQRAGALIAHEVVAFCSQRGLDGHVTFLVGKGHNGGDALVCARILQQEGFSTTCILASEELHPLTEKMLKAYLAAHGQLGTEIGESGVIVDGLLGTGYQGSKLHPHYGRLIEAANTSGLAIIAIDIPSGLSGDDGLLPEVGPVIRAKLTLSLGALKQGMFLSDALELVGDWRCLDFGLDAECLEKAQSGWKYLDKAWAKEHLPKIKRTRHKYQAGSVFFWAGSRGMMGAADMSSLAALKSGAGLVWLMHPEDVGAEIASVPWEVIKLGVRGQDYAQQIEVMQKAQALVVGPGLGRSEVVTKALQGILPKLNKPMVLDGDALDIFARVGITFAAPVVMTPHRDELRRLLGQKRDW